MQTATIYRLQTAVRVNSWQMGEKDDQRWESNSIFKDTFLEQIIEFHFKSYLWKWTYPWTSLSKVTSHAEVISVNISKDITIKEIGIALLSPLVYINRWFADEGLQNTDTELETTTGSTVLNKTCSPSLTCHSTYIQSQQHSIIKVAVFNFFFQLINYSCNYSIVYPIKLFCILPLKIK